MRHFSHGRFRHQFRFLSRQFLQDGELPLSSWTVLGAPTEAPAGQYQFTDSQTTNNPQRFYRVVLVP